MKRIFTTIVCLILLMNLYAQDYKEVINRNYSAYVQLIQEKKFEEAMNYISPQVFEVITKRTLMKGLQQIFETPGLEFQLETPDIIRHGDIVKVDTVEYVRFVTHMILSMKTDETQDAEPDQLLATLKNNFGGENVTYDEKTGFFRIKAIKDVLATSTDKGRNWKFIVLDNEHIIELLEGLIPEELLQLSDEIETNAN